MEDRTETMLSQTDKELEILKAILERAGGVHQRDLARIVDLSLGMTNAILKGLAERGWIMIRKVNNRNIRYACEREAVVYLSRDPEDEERVFHLHSEDYIPDDEVGEAGRAPNRGFLQEYLVR